MNRTFKYIGILSLVFTLAACSGENHQENPSQNIKSSSEEVRVELENGEPWRANAETIEGLEKMKSILQENESVPASRIKNKNLIVALTDQLNYITAKCTMTGKAHEQLHNYLMPVKDYIDEINSTDLSEAQKGVDKLQRHLNNYPKYFTM